LPGLRCEYVYAGVEARGVGQTFTQNWRYRSRPNLSKPLARFTRVTLTTDPQRWDRDLELVPGTTAVGTAALAVTGWVGFLGPLWSGLLGAALGLLIPVLTVPKAERWRIDWFIGLLTGAAIVLTI